MILAINGKLRDEQVWGNNVFNEMLSFLCWGTPRGVIK